MNFYGFYKLAAQINSFENTRCTPQGQPRRRQAGPTGQRATARARRDARARTRGDGGGGARRDGEAGPERAGEGAHGAEGMEASLTGGDADQER